MRFWGKTWKDRRLALALVALFAVVEIFAVRQRVRVAVLAGVAVAVVVAERKLREKERQDAIEEELAVASLARQREEYRRIEKELAAHAAKGEPPKRTEELKGFLRIADAAFKRNELVEAHYWAIMAFNAGETGARRAMTRYRVAWKAQGCRPFQGVLWLDFPIEAVKLSLAVLRYNCRIDEVTMMNKILYYAKHGNADAALYLKAIRAREHAKREEVRKEG